MLFTSAIDAIDTLSAAKAAGQLKRDLARYLRPRLLIVDKLGILPVDKTGADLLFQIISQRYERGSIATNKPFLEWADVLSSAARVATLVDRLIHHSEIVQLDGVSYRLREAKEQAATRSKARSRRSAKSRASRGP